MILVGYNKILELLLFITINVLTDEISNCLEQLQEQILSHWTAQRYFYLSVCSGHIFEIIDFSLWQQSFFQIHLSFTLNWYVGSGAASSLKISSEEFDFSSFQEKSVILLLCGKQPEHDRWQLVVWWSLWIQFCCSSSKVCNKLICCNFTWAAFHFPF